MKLNRNIQKDIQLYISIKNSKKALLVKASTSVSEAFTTVSEGYPAQMLFLANKNFSRRRQDPNS